MEKKSDIRGVRLYAVFCQSSLGYEIVEKEIAGAAELFGKL